MEAENARLRAALAETQAALAETQAALANSRKECEWLVFLRDSLKAYNTIESERLIMRRCSKHSCSDSAFIFPLPQ
jgi:hypothetical protein